MAKLDVTEPLARALMREVAPIVERLTGWRLHVEQMAVQILPKTQAYEEIFLARLQRLSPSGDLSAFSEGIARRLAEYVLEGTTLAAYDHTNGTLYVVRENVDDSDKDGLKVILGHELVHRGQGLHHPDLLRRTEQVAAEVLSAETISGKMEKIQEANAVLTLFGGPRDPGTGRPAPPVPEGENRAPLGDNGAPLSQPRLPQGAPVHRRHQASGRAQVTERTGGALPKPWASSRAVRRRIKKEEGHVVRAVDDANSLEGGALAASSR